MFLFDYVWLKVLILQSLSLKESFFKGGLIAFQGFSYSCLSPFLQGVRNLCFGTGRMNRISTLFRALV